MPARAPETLAVAFPSHRPRALTGTVELALGQTAWSRAARPALVSRVLELMFDPISGQPVSPARVRFLASSAREWLLQQAALRIWPDQGWFQARCATCGHDVDMPVTLSGAPRKAANSDFPAISVATSLGRRRFEAPNGAHEEALARTVGGDPARRLLALCGLADTARADAEAFSAEDLVLIETAFDEACPDIADAVSAACPSCQATIEARIDPLQFAFPPPKTVLREVHAIAAAYHWSEEEILALPSSRRVAYAELIGADRTGGSRR